MENKRQNKRRAGNVLHTRFPGVNIQSNFLFVRRLLFIEGKLSMEIINKNKKLGGEHDCFSSGIFAGN